MVIHSLEVGGNKITDTSWLSECCDAVPMGDRLDESTTPYGGPSGFCSTCKDNCIFVEEDKGNPFDTKEEKYGER